MAQRKLDHFAQRIDRVAHPTKVVVRDVGAALSLAVPSGVLGQQLDGRLAVDVDDPRRRGRDHHQPQFLQRERRRIEQLADMVGHVGVDALVARRGDRVASDQGPPGEGALQRLGRPLQPNVGLGRREDDPRRGLRIRPC